MSDKNAMMFQPGDSQYTQARNALRRDGYDPSDYLYQVSYEVQNSQRLRHRFKKKGAQKWIEVEA